MDKKIKMESREIVRLSVEEYMSSPKMPVKVCLDNVRSAYNVGAVLRSCDVFHVEELICGGYTAVPPHPEIAKTALGADKTVKTTKVSDLKTYLEGLKREGYVVVCVEHTRVSVPLSQLRIMEDKKYVIVFGNELLGISEEVLSLGDVFVEVEQGGTKHSLNVSVCAGIVLWFFFTKFKDKICKYGEAEARMD